MKVVILDNMLHLARITIVTAKIIKKRRYFTRYIEDKTKKKKKSLKNENNAKN